ncbi:Mu transposase C-terminal domain-containing protein [Serratia marcescens]|uniref:Mu transposase C-terminal domain-containing protein n=1 Tax=Serratia marcescens TaxID=615 RepID=UPI0040454B6B
MFVIAKELVGIPGLPATTKGIREALSRNAGDSSALKRKREGSKAFEYHIDCLPAEAREIVRQRHYKSVLEQSGCKSVDVPVPNKRPNLKSPQQLEIMRKCPALLDRKVQSLNDQQKQIADARMTLAIEVLRMMDTFKMSRKGAVEYLASESKKGSLPERMQNAAFLANARKGSTRTGVSVRALQGWVSDYMAAETPGERLAALAPGKIQAKTAEQIPWLPVFLKFYRVPNRPSVEMAYEEFSLVWQEQYVGNEHMLALMPPVHSVRRALKKIPKAELERGRVTGAEHKSLLPFVRRDWSALPVNGAWIGDGHGMKLEVYKPGTNTAFRPEITLVIEGPTRVIVGWSLALSENQVAVGDAIRHGISQFGVPLIYYSDNGGGEKNKTFDADITGIFSRLGIDHQTGIPGNPQARGIIERINREIPMRAAKKFGSYVGKSGDRETQRIYQKRKDSALNAIENGKTLSPMQQAVLATIPSWDDLIAEIEVQVQRHNSRPHDSLPKRDNGQHWSPLAYRNHLISKDKIEIDYLTSAELHEMFRPEVIRKAVRGEVRVYNNIYFSTELARVEGEKVRVCFDIHDPNTVIVRHMDGTWICDAIWDGNKVDAFAKPYVKRLEEKRVKERRERQERKIYRDIERELTPAIEQKPEHDFSRFFAPEPEQRQKVYLHEDDYEFDLKKASNSH